MLLGEQDEEHLKIIRENVPAGNRVDWVNSDYHYLLDLSSQRKLNPRLYPTRINRSGEDSEAGFLLSRGWVLRKHQQLIDKRGNGASWQKKATQGKLVIWEKIGSTSAPLLPEVKLAGSAFVGGFFLLIPLVGAGVALLRRQGGVSFGNTAFVAGLGALLCFLTETAFQTSFVNTAETGIWIYKAQVLYQEGWSGFFALLEDPGGKVSRTGVSPLHAVLVAVMAWLNAGFHADLGRVLGIFGVVGTGLATLGLLRASILRYGITALVVTVPVLLRCAVWGHVESLVLLLLAVGLLLYQKFLQSGAVPAFWGFLITLVAMSLLKMEAALLAVVCLIFIHSTAISGRQRFGAGVALCLVLIWPLWAVIRYPPGDFSIAALQSRGWSGSVEVFQLTLSFLKDSLIVDKVLLRGVVSLIVGGILLAAIFRERMRGKWLWGAGLAYAVAFVFIFPLSVFFDPVELRVWHFPSLSRIFLAAGFLTIVVPLAFLKPNDTKV